MPRVRTREWASTDYYAVLGADPGAPGAALDARYRELAKELHPDSGADADAQERFKQVSAAYGVLRDPSSRAAYDEFRSRLAAGTLPDSRGSAPEPAFRGPADHFAPPRIPRRRAPVPQWARTVISAALIALGFAAVGWAALGDLPTPTAADTPVAVQITLVIMAVKLVVCGLIVAYYPQLRARWHR